MVVGAVLPAGRPDELVHLREALQLRPGDVGDAVRHPVDQMEAAAEVLERAVEAEQADHPVNVDRQNRSFISHEASVAAWPCYLPPPCRALIS